MTANFVMGVGGFLFFFVCPSGKVEKCEEGMREVDDDSMA